MSRNPANTPVEIRLRVPQSTKDALVAHCEATKRSQSSMIRYLVESYDPVAEAQAVLARAGINAVNSSKAAPAQRAPKPKTREQAALGEAWDPRYPNKVKTLLVDYSMPEMMALGFTEDELRGGRITSREIAEREKRILAGLPPVPPKDDLPQLDPDLEAFLGPGSLSEGY